MNIGVFNSFQACLRSLIALKRLIPMMKTTGLLLTVLCCSWAGTANAQVFSDVDSGTYSMEDISGGVSLGNNGSYLLLRKDSGDRVGDQDGFMSFGLHAPLKMLDYDGGMLLYTNPRLFVTDHSRIGGNISVGTRILNQKYNRIFGFNLAYDTDDSRDGNRYQQVTTSVEWLGDGWDLRANGYFPVSDDETNLGISILGDTAVFNPDLGILEFTNADLIQEALKGADVELGVPIPNQPWLKAYLGTYYYDVAEDSDLVGFRGRLSAQVTTDTSIEFAVTEDSKYGTNFNVGVSLQFSGSGNFQFFPTRSIDQRFHEQVMRNYRVALNHFDRFFQAEALIDDGGDIINPDDPNAPPGSAISIIFVDDTNPTIGEGSFANPWRSVTSQAQTDFGDIIVIRTGSTSAGAPATSNFELIDNQRILGEGAPHLISGIVIDFPGLATSGPKPWYTTGAGGNIIELADNNEVSNIGLVSPTGGNAIFGTGFDSFNINKVMITGDGGGIILNNASGTGAVTDSTIDLFGAAVPGGIVINNVNTDPLSLSINNTEGTPPGTPGSTGAIVGFRLSGDNSDITAVIENFRNSGSGSGIELNAENGGILDIAIRESHFDLTTGAGGATGHAFGVTGDSGGQIDLLVLDSSFDGASGDGLYVSLLDGAIFDGEINDSTFDGSGGNGINLMLDDSTGSNLALTRISADGSGVDGMHIDLDNNSTLTVNVTDGSFVGSTDDALETLLDGTSTLNISIDPTPMTGSGDDGFAFMVAGGSTLNGLFEDANLSTSGGNGIYGMITGASTVDLEFMNSPVDGNGENGLLVTATGDSLFNAEFDSVAGAAFGPTSFNDNGLGAAGNAFHLILSDSTSNITMNNTTGTGSGADGLLLEATLGSVLNIDVTDGSFSNSSQDGGGDDGISVSSSASAITLNLLDTSSSNTGGNVTQFDGLSMLASVGGTITANVTSTDINSPLFDDNTDNAFAAIVTGATSEITLNLDMISADNSGGEGLLFGVSAGTLNVNSTNSTFDGSGMDGIAGLAVTSSEVNFDFTGTSVTNSGDDGLLLLGTTGATFNGTFVDGSFANSGQNGGIDSAINVDIDASTANLTFDNTDANNTLGGTTQDYGFNFDVTTGATLTAIINNGNFSDNTLSAFNGTVNGATSSATFTLDTVLGDRSGENGIDLVNTAGTFSFSATNSSFTDSGFNAVNAALTGGSTTTFTFDGSSLADSGQDVGSNVVTQRNGIYLTNDASTVTLNLTDTLVNNTLGNTSQENGFQFSLTNAGTLDATLLRANLDDNQNNAIQGTIDGAGSVATISLDNTSADRSGSDGFIFDLTNAGELFLNGSNNSSIDDAGRNAIEITMTGGSESTINLSDTTASGASKHGLYINAVDSTLNASTITNGSFANSGVLANRNAMRFELDNSTFTDLTVTNTLATGSGGDGLHIEALNGSSFTGTMNTVDFSNSGQFAANRGGIIIHGTGGSAIDLTTDGSDSGNTGGNTTQDYGFGFTLDDASTLVASISNASFSDNDINAIFGSVTNPGTTADVTFDSVIADNSGEDGAIFSVTDEAILTFNMISTNSASSISNSGGHGVTSTVTGNGVASDTIANFTFEGTSLDSNGQDLLLGGDGFHAAPTNGGRIVASFTDGSISNNRDDGINIELSDTLSSVDFTLTDTIVINNGDAGFELNLSNGATFDSTFTNGFFNSNNTGIRVTVTDTGPEANLTFNGTTANNNDEFGFDFLVENEAELNVSMQNGVTASNNGTSGVRFIGQDANTIGSLTMGGANVFNSNGILANSDGIDIDITDIALFTFSFAGTADGNANNGIDLNATDTTIDSFSLTGTVTNNGSFPLSQAAGVNLNFDNTTIDAFTIIAADISSNTGRGLNLTSSGSTFTTGGSITNSRASLNSGGDGIRIDMTNTTVSAPFIFADNTEINSNNGDGILLSLNDTPITELTFENNLDISSNTGNGINLLLDTSKLTSLVIDGNNIDGNTEDGMLFDITDSAVDGQIVDNTINNNLGNGISFNDPQFAAIGTIDFGTVASDSYITGNDISGNGGAGILVDISDNVNFLGELADNTINGNEIGLSVIADGDAVFDIEIDNKLLPITESTFDANNFAGIAFNLSDTAVGDVAIADATVTNTTNSGTHTTLAGEGIHFLLDDFAELNTTTIDNEGKSISDNAGDGIGILLLEESEMLSLEIANAVISGNAGDGIGIRREDKSLIAAIIDSNTVTGNSGNGFDLFATNRQDELTFDFTDNIFDSNTDGMSFELHADAVVLVTADRNQMSSNTQNGLSILTAERTSFGNAAAVTESVFNNSIINNNGSDGINLDANDTSRTLLLVQSPVDALFTGRTSISGNGGNGVNFLGNDETVSIFTLYGADIQGNTSNGINIQAGEFFDTAGIFSDSITPRGAAQLGALSQRSNNTIIVGGIGAVEGNDISNNGLNGLNIATNGGIIDFNDDGSDPASAKRGSILDIDIVNNTMNNNSTDGISIQSNQNSHIDAVIDTNISRFNGVRGLDILLTGDVGHRVNSAGVESGGVVFAITTNVFSDNESEGMVFETNSETNGNTTMMQRVRLENTAATAPTTPFAVTNNLLAPYDPREGGVGNLEFYTEAIGSNRGREFNDGVFGQGRYEAGTATDPLFPWNNMYTDIAARTQVTANIVRDNGTGVDSHGMLFKVGSNSYIAAEVENNTFGGNVLSDFRTEAVLSTDQTGRTGSAIVPPPRVDTSGVNTFDTVTLDDTAQLDLRFNLNTGDQIDVAGFSDVNDSFYPSNDPGFYTNTDPGKSNGNNGNRGVGNDSSGPAFTRQILNNRRRFDLFQVDDITHLDDTFGPVVNNDFSQFGIDQNIESAFTERVFEGTLFGNYLLTDPIKLIPDGLYPNYDFPPPVP